MEIADYRAWECPSHPGVYVHPVGGECGQCGWSVPEACPKHPQYLLKLGWCEMCRDWTPGEPIDSGSEDLSEGTEIEQVETVVAELMEIEKFEGSDVVDWEMKLPATSVECERSFKRGSVVRLAVEVRIRGVGYTEKKDGNLVRIHQATLEDISVISVFDPSQNHENVGGGLSGTAPDELDNSEEQPNPLDGLQVGRTQDQWPPREQEAS